MRDQRRAATVHRLHIDALLRPRAFDPIREARSIRTRVERDAPGEGLEDPSRAAVRDDELLTRTDHPVIYGASVGKPDRRLEPAGALVDATKCRVGVGHAELRGPH